jgi:hypothetical protein
VFCVGQRLDEQIRWEKRIGVGVLVRASWGAPFEAQRKAVLRPTRDCTKGD